MGLALYLVGMGLLFGGLGAFMRWTVRPDRPVTPNMKSLTIGLEIFASPFYYGGLAALAAGLLLGLAQLAAGLLG